MTKLKLVFAALLTLLVTVTGGKVFAEDVSYTLTLNETTTGHTYEAYQIFTGDLSGDTLSNITWGSGVNTAGQTALGDATTQADSLDATGDDSITAQIFAQKVSQYLGTSSASVESTSGTTIITGLTAGYYLVKDADSSQSGENSSYTRFILEVVKDTTATLKADVPTVEKKVIDTNDTTGITSDWQDSADYDINDAVPFQLTATLPSNYDAYAEYYLEFKDTLSAGLTFNNDAKVYLVNGATETEITSNFTIANNGSSYKINNLKVVSGVTSSSKIVVRYTATLNSNAVIGSVGNPNTVNLVYSNNPNYTGAGENSPKGETPKDTVIIFTYQVIVNKVDNNNVALAGAGFTLYKKDVNGAYQVVEVITAGSATTFTFRGLDDGDYKLSETTTPSGYNTMTDVEFTVTADHDILSDSPALTSLSGNVKNGDLAFTSNLEDGSLVTTVVNKKGSVLPSTGSTGTRALYLVGVVLILSAAVLFVTKKRMNTK